MEEKNQPILINKILKKKHFWMIMSVVFVVVVVALGVYTYKVIYNYNIPEEAKDDNQVQNQISENMARRNIDGVYVEKGKENIYPLAIMMDNHPDARPLSSVSKANLVIEAEAEGRITRFLAIFASDDDLSEIGPVRSARPYYIDWAREFSAMYVHVGGSPEALARMAKESFLHINEFYEGEYFWRASKRLSPHNVYTSSKNLREYLKSKDLNEGKFFSWNFKDDIDLSSRPEISEIKINYKLSSYIVDWKYDKENNDYIRYVAGEEYRDESGENIKAKNVIIQKIKAEEIDEDLRLRMETIGEGEAVICLDGECKDGKWKKTSASSRTRFYNNEDNEIEFNAGTTWIEVIRPEYEVEY